MGRGEVTNIDDVDGVVGGERLEFREEQDRCVGKKGMGEEHRVIAAFPLLEEVISGAMSAEAKGKSRSGPNY